MPALLAPDVRAEQALKDQYEKELEIAQNTELPDGDEDENL